MDDMMISLANCCSPVRGEPIVGYITRGKGVSVHSAQCQNVAQLMYDSERRIDVEWSSGKDGQSLFDVTLVLYVEDQQGLLATHGDTSITISSGMLRGVVDTSSSVRRSMK